MAGGVGDGFRAHVEGKTAGFYWDGLDSGCGEKGTGGDTYSFGSST